jgi:hypothetical protein
MKFLIAPALAIAAALNLGAAAPTEPDAVSFELNSWGKPLDRWTIMADGSGELTTSSQKPGADFNDYTLAVQKLGPDPARYGRLIEALRPAQAFAGKTLPCGERATDMPYGSASWRRAGAERRLEFNVGCSSAKARKVIESLHAADGLVRQWAADAPKVETAPPSQP